MTEKLDNATALYMEGIRDGNDIFRLEDGLIVEHRDNVEAIGPEEEWVNSGKF